MTKARVMRLIPPPVKRPAKVVPGWMMYESGWACLMSSIIVAWAFGTRRLNIFILFKGPVDLKC